MKKRALLTVLLTLVFAFALFTACDGGTSCKHEMTTHEFNAATCTKDGNELYYECGKCGKLFEDEEGKTETTLDKVTIKARHTYKHEWESDETEHWQICAICGAKDEDSKASHDFSSGNTCICGRQTVSEGLFYEWNSEDDTFTVTDIWDCKDVDLIIPDTYYDMPVTGIGDDAFSRCDFLKSVTIGENVTSIGKHAFFDCVSLQSITIGKNVTSIGDAAFMYCDKLVEVYDLSPHLDIQKGSTDNGGVGYHAEFVHTTKDAPSKLDKSDDGYIFFTSESGENYLFDYRGKDVELILPSDYKGGDYSIYKNAFYDYDKVTSVVIPDSVTSIGSDAFFDCTNLEEVRYKGDMTSWCNINFEDYTSNPLYYGKNLYIGDTKIEGKLEIPYGVTEIKSCAFQKCNNITSVVIPDSVTKIGSYAFENCPNLESVTIGESVASIGNSAFMHCTALESVTIGENVTSIGGSAFMHCTALKSVTIGESVARIGLYAFSDCISLGEVTFEVTENWQVTGVWYTTPSAGAEDNDVFFWTSDVFGWTDLIAEELADKSQAAEYLSSAYSDYYWRRLA